MSSFYNLGLPDFQMPILAGSLICRVTRFSLRVSMVKEREYICDSCLSHRYSFSFISGSMTVLWMFEIIGNLTFLVSGIDLELDSLVRMFGSWPCPQIFGSPWHSCTKSCRKGCNRMADYHPPPCFATWNWVGVHVCMHKSC